MEPYKRPYFLLFNRITDALEVLEQEGKDGIDTAADLLRQAQADAEELFIEDLA